MLTNATILRIDRQGATDATGRPRFTAGAAVAIRCCLDQITGRQRYTLGAVLNDAGQVIYVERPALAAAGEAIPANGTRLMVQADGADATHSVTVVTTGDRLGPAGGGLSHAELFVRRGADDA